MRDISERFGLAVDPKARIEDITVGQQQRVEILKALYRNADILVLDEPTAVLTPQEAGELFEIIRGLTEQGKSIIFISHKLNEVTEVADRITVLRRGKRIETLPAEGATEQSLARLMVGREVLLRVDKGPSNPTDVAARVEDLHVFDDRGIEKVRGLSLEVRAGEIVGIAGIDGNGQTELIDAMTGLRKVDLGPGHPWPARMSRATAPWSLRLGPRSHSRGPTAPRPRARVLDRGEHRPPRLSPRARLEGGLAVPGPPSRACGAPDQGVRRSRRRRRRPAQAALSGGNQQKVVLAREIDRNPKVLIAAQPTRGLDVGAIEFVHRRIVEERDEGRGILLVSLELEEILSLSDRILVMYEGEIVGEYPPSTSEEQLGIAMTGGGRGPRRPHGDERARGRGARGARETFPREVPPTHRGWGLRSSSRSSGATTSLRKPADCSPRY